VFRLPSDGSRGSHPSSAFFSTVASQRPTRVLRGGCPWWVANEGIVYQIPRRRARGFFKKSEKSFGSAKSPRKTTFFQHANAADRTQQPHPCPCCGGASSGCGLS